MKSVNDIHFINRRNNNNIFKLDLWGLATSHKGLYGNILAPSRTPIKAKPRDALADIFASIGLPPPQYDKSWRDRSSIHIDISNDDIEDEDAKENELIVQKETIGGQLISIDESDDNADIDESDDNTDISSQLISIDKSDDNTDIDFDFENEPDAKERIFAFDPHSKQTMNIDTTEINRLNKELYKLAQKLDASQNEARQQSRTIESLENMNKKLTSNVEDLEKTIEQQEQETATLRGKNSELAFEASSKDIELMEMNHTKQLLEQKNKEIEALKQSITNNPNVDQSEQITTLQKTIDELNKSIQAKNTDILAKEQEKAKIQQEDAQKIQKLRTEIEKLAYAFHEKQEQYNSSENSVKLLEQKMGGLTTERDKYIQSITLAKQKISQLQNELQTLSKESQKAIENKDTTLATARNEIEQLRQNLLAKSRELTETTLTLQNKDTTLATAQNQIQQMKQNLLAKSSELTKTTTSLQLATQTKEKSELQLQRHIQLLQDANNKINELQQQHSNLQLVKASSTKESDALRKDKQQLQINLQQMQIKLNEFQHNNTLLTQQLNNEKQKNLQIVKANTDNQNSIHDKIKNVTDNFHSQLQEHTKQLQNAYTEKLNLQRTIATQNNQIQQAQQQQQRTEQELKRIQQMYEQMQQQMQQKSQIRAIMPPSSNTSNVKASPAVIDKFQAPAPQMQQQMQPQMQMRSIMAPSTNVNTNINNNNNNMTPSTNVNANVRAIVSLDDLKQFEEQLKNAIPQSIIDNYVAYKNNGVFSNPTEAGEFLNTEYKMYNEANLAMTTALETLKQNKTYGAQIQEWINAYRDKYGKNKQPEYEIIDKVNDMKNLVDNMQDRKKFRQQYWENDKPASFSHGFAVEEQWKEMMEWINDTKEKEDLTEKFENMSSVTQKLKLLDKIAGSQGNAYSKRFTDNFNLFHEANQIFFRLPGVVLEMEKEYRAEKLKMDIAREISRMRNDDASFKKLAQQFIDEKGKIRANIINKYKQKYSKQLSNFKDKTLATKYQQLYSKLDNFYKISSLSSSYNVGADIDEIREDNKFNLKQALTKCISLIEQYTKNEQIIENQRKKVEAKLTASQLDDLEAQYWKDKEDKLETTIDTYKAWNTFYTSILSGKLKPPPVDNRDDREIEKDLLDELWEVRNDWKKIIKKFLPEYKSKVLNATKAYRLFSKKYHPDRVDNLFKQRKLTTQQARERKLMFKVAEPYFVRMRKGKKHFENKKAERAKWNQNAQKAADEEYLRKEEEANRKWRQENAERLKREKEEERKREEERRRNKGNKFYSGNFGWGDL